MTGIRSVKIGKAVGTSGGWSRRASVTIRALGGRMRPLVMTAGILLLLFNLFRGILLLYHVAVVRGVGPGAVVRCFWIALWYDAVPVGYILLPMVVAMLLAPEKIFRRKWFRRIVTAYAAVALTVVIAVEVIGTGFFIQFNQRLNWMALGYIYLETAKHLLYSYPIWAFVLITPVLLIGIYRIWSKYFWPGIGPRESSPWLRLTAGVLTTGLCILACRGGLASHPLRPGKAYYSTNLIVDQLALNNFFTIGRAAISNLTDNRTEKGLYPFPDYSTAEAVTMDLLYQDTDEPAGTKGNPLWRRTQTHRAQNDYNVVIILMEGMSSFPVGALGYSPSHTPVLDEICNNGLFFERMYAVGARTSRAIVGTLCGHPDMGGISVLQRKKALGKFLTLPGIFRRRGYYTMFIYGGKPKFDNMGQFLQAGGTCEVIGKAEMKNYGPAYIWGAADEAVFRKAHEKFESMNGQPFFATILTISNHEPYQVPSGRVELLGGDSEEVKYINAYRYADWALGEFFRYASSSSYFERTIFVLVADHGRKLNRRRILDVPGYRVPCVIYAPSLPDVVPVYTVKTVASQTDIAPTLLALLGGRYEHCFMGRNILRVPQGDGFALLHEDDRLGFVTHDRALIMPPNQKAILFRTDAFSMEAIQQDETYSQEIELLQRRMLSFYLVARRLYQTGRYNRPDGRLAARPGRPRR